MTVVKCAGRIVEGDESAALQQHLDALMPTDPHIVLHLGDVEFIDSSGLGLLVRNLTRAMNAHASLKVCAVSPKVRDVLRVTKLHTVLHPYDTEAEAIADGHRVTRTKDVSAPKASVLCVHRAPDVLAYLRELLKEAGYRVITAENLPDALILLTATQPDVVVMGAELRAVRGTRAAEEFHKLADLRRVVELPPDFASHDAGEAAQQILAQVRTIPDAVEKRQIR
jgi:anti-sigma B factor antagonist